ncbi:MAG: XcyI family restriction endonuclease [Bacteroidia bacterium]|nr:XcyI family restriction endonuclease [Bacteroidia bacterium]
MAKKIKKKNIGILAEAHKISYRLRSTFFYRKLYEYKTFGFSSTIAQLIPHSENYNWNDYENWGISKTAFEIIEKSKLKMIQVFSHAKLLREHPDLIGYYRNVAVLSQKATKYLSNIDTKRFEENNKTDITETQAAALAQLFNEHVSLIIENALEQFKEQEIQGLLFASTGAQIDGSWRNAIGEEAEKVVQVMLTQETIRKNLLEAFIMRENGKIVTPDKSALERIIKNIKEIKGIMLTNQKSILFSSEPDLTIIGSTGKSELVIEVKGGTDPAGALERYGASKKSLEHSIRENKKVKTCFLASCITDEVEKRVKADKTISKYFNLTKVLTNENYKAGFLKYVFDVVMK